MNLDALFRAASGACDVPGCTHVGHGGMFFHARCHPKEGVWVEVNPESRTIRVTCGVCKLLVVEIECAPEPLVGFRGFHVPMPSVCEACQRMLAPPVPVIDGGCIHFWRSVAWGGAS